MTLRPWHRGLLAATTILAAAAVASADAPADAPATPRVLLQTNSGWRCHFTWLTEQARRDNGELQYVTTKSVGREGTALAPVETPGGTPPPPAGWREADFDDGGWVRARGPFYTRATREIAMICLRGKFEVRDPAAAGPLALSLGYHGGAVVCVNGKEIARANLPAGELTAATVAEDYPKQAYADPDGFLLRWVGFGDPEKYRPLFDRRGRSVADVVIPSSMLRKGTNVLAVELHRAPTAELLFAGRPREHTKTYCWWSMIGLTSLKLTAAGDGVVANVARPEGLQVWTHPVFQSLHNADYGDPCEPLGAVAIRGTSNGAFSGQLIVGSREPLRGLKVEAGPLKAAGGAQLPADAVELRYAQATGDPEMNTERMYPWDGGTASQYDKGVRRFETLSPTVAAEVPVDPAADGAVVPVWVTVHVPADAAAGRYDGQILCRVEGAEPVRVPLQVDVAGFVLPDPKQFVTHIGLIQSPDTLAIQYGVPMWSPRHWELIEQSFRLLGEVGDKVLYLPVIRRTYFGNEHSMVRWIRKADGTYGHDFSIVEKYLDTAIKHLGKVPMVCVYCWDVGTGSAYMGGGNEVEKAGMPFTVVNPKTGELEAAVGPKWGEPATREFWKPVMDGIHQLLIDRGMGEAMHVGVAGDRRPDKDAVEDLKAAAPYAGWVVSSHNMPNEMFGQPVGYATGVWGLFPAPDPATGRYYGWKNPLLRAAFPRFGSSVIGFSLQTPTALGAYLIAAEATITSRGAGAGLRGVARCGADFWYVLKGKYRSEPILGQFPENSAWHGGWLHNSTPYVLAPGENGPVATPRFEMLREGLQEAETRIFLEKALSDAARRGKLGDELAAKCQAILDERVRANRRAIAGMGSYVTWVSYVGSGVGQRRTALFEAAAEAAAKLAE